MPSRVLKICKCVKTIILKETPEKRTIERTHEEKKKIRKKGTYQEKFKLTKRKVIVYSSSEESNVPIPLADTESESSEDDSHEPMISALSVDNFVVVHFATQCKNYHCIGLIETLEGDQVEAKTFAIMPNMQLRVYT